MLPQKPACGTVSAREILSGMLLLLLQLVAVAEAVAAAVAVAVAPIPVASLMP